MFNEIVLTFKSDDPRVPSAGASGSSLQNVYSETISFYYHPNSHANIKGATIVASLSTINLGVSISSLPHVIFSLGTAPEYEP